VHLPLLNVFSGCGANAETGLLGSKQREGESSSAKERKAKGMGGWGERRKAEGDRKETDLLCEVPVDF